MHPSIPSAWYLCAGWKWKPRDRELGPGLHLGRQICCQSESGSMSVSDTFSSFSTAVTSTMLAENVALCSVPYQREKLEKKCEEKLGWEWWISRWLQTVMNNFKPRVFLWFPFPISASLTFFTNWVFIQPAMCCFGEWNCHALPIRRLDIGKVVTSETELLQTERWLFVEYTAHLRLTEWIIKRLIVTESQNTKMECSRENLER